MIYDSPLALKCALGKLPFYPLQPRKGSTLLSALFSIMGFLFSILSFPFNLLLCAQLFGGSVWDSIASKWKWPPFMDLTYLHPTHSLDSSFAKTVRQRRDHEGCHLQRRPPCSFQCKDCELTEKNTTNTQSSPNGSFVWKAHSKNGRTAHYFF